MNRITKLASAGLLAASLAFVGGTAYAAGGGDAAGWVGVQGGMSVPNYSNTSARSLFGITGGAKVGSEFGVGGYYQSSKKDEAANGVTFSFGYDLYGVMLAYQHASRLLRDPQAESRARRAFDALLGAAHASPLAKQMGDHG